MHALAVKEDQRPVMPTHESWTDYVRRITKGKTRKEIAAAAGIDVSGVSRWLSGTSRPSPEKVISFARGMNQPPVAALIAAGYLENTDIRGVVEVVQSITVIPDDLLVDELRDRLRSRVSDDAQGSGLARIEAHGIKPRVKQPEHA